MVNIKSQTGQNYDKLTFLYQKKCVFIEGNNEIRKKQRKEHALPHIESHKRKMADVNVKGKT